MSASARTACGAALCCEPVCESLPPRRRSLRAPSRPGRAFFFFCFGWRAFGCLSPPRASLPPAEPPSPAARITGGLITSDLIRLRTGGLITGDLPFGGVTGRLLTCRPATTTAAAPTLLGVAVAGGLLAGRLRTFLPRSDLSPWHRTPPWHLGPWTPAKPLRLPTKRSPANPAPAWLPFRRHWYLRQHWARRRHLALRNRSAGRFWARTRSRAERRCGEEPAADKARVSKEIARTAFGATATVRAIPFAAAVLLRSGLFPQIYDARIHDSILSTVGNTPIVRLARIGRNLPTRSSTPSVSSSTRAAPSRTASGSACCSTPRSRAASSRATR